MTASEAKEKTEIAIKNKDKEFDKLLKEVIPDVYEAINEATDKGEFSVYYNPERLEVIPKLCEYLRTKGFKADFNLVGTIRIIWDDEPTIKEK